MDVDLCWNLSACQNGANITFIINGVGQNHSGCTGLAGEPGRSEFIYFVINFFII